MRELIASRCDLSEAQDSRAGVKQELSGVGSDTRGSDRIAGKGEGDRLSNESLNYVNT